MLSDRQDKFSKIASALLSRIFRVRKSRHQTSTMDKLNRDLHYFEQELQRENDHFRRNLLLQEIVRVKREMVILQQQEITRETQEIDNLRRALDMVEAKEALRSKK
jgi:hypothetical protein